MASALVPLGRFQLDAERRLLIGDVGEAPLSPISTRLLCLLAERPGVVVGRDALIEQLWAGNYLVGEQALNRVVSETRRAARTAGTGRLIETVQKSGYRLQTRPTIAEFGPVPRRSPGFRAWLGALILIVVVFAGLLVVIEKLAELRWAAGFAN